MISNYFTLVLCLSLVFGSSAHSAGLTEEQWNRGATSAKRDISYKLKLVDMCASSLKDASDREVAELAKNLQATGSDLRVTICSRIVNELATGKLTFQEYCATTHKCPSKTGDQ